MRDGIIVSVIQGEDRAFDESKAYILDYGEAAVMPGLVDV